MIPLQQKQLEMLVDLDHFCTEYDIEWCLGYGSVLGARRHGGPIPWDDDVDIIMTAESYERFKTTFQKYGDHNKYYLQEKIIVDGMVNDPKIRMNHTTFIEPQVAHMDMHQGFYIDIFIMHNVPQNGFKFRMGMLAGIYMDLKTLSNQHYTKRKIVGFLMAFLRLFPRDFGMRSALRLEYSFDAHPSDQMMVWCIGSKPWPKDVIFPIRRMDYAGVSLPVPNKVEDYLELCYGSWQQIPDAASISWHQHVSTWSTTEDFRTFLPHVRDFSDEMGSEASLSSGRHPAGR